MSEDEQQDWPSFDRPRLGVVNPGVGTDADMRTAYQELRDGMLAIARQRDAALVLAARRLEVLDAIGKLLEDNGCDCDCDHHHDEHDDDCEQCLGCRISAVLAREPEGA